MTYEEFEEKMAREFPEMFGEDCHYGGFAIGEGWYPIIERLCSNIQTHLKWHQHSRQRLIDLFNAREQGRDALLNVLKGKSATPSQWEEEEADLIMANGVTIPEAIPTFRVAQIKEKFGGLRFYYDGGDEYVSGLVAMAEEWAGCTCETCGERGKRRDGGWVRTLCDKHEEEYQAKQANMRSEDD